MTQSNSFFDKQMMRHATWGAALLTAAGLLFVVVGFAIAEINSWKDYILLGAPAMLFILGLTSIVLLRRGRVFLGTSLIFVANLIVPLTENLFQTGIGTAIFVYTLVSSVLLIWRSLPRTSYRWASILTGAALLFIIVTEIIKPSFRISPADELVAFIFIVTALLTVSFIFQAVRETWGQNMRNKLLVAFVGVTLVATAALAVYAFVSTSNILQQELEKELTQHTQGVADQVSSLLSNQIDQVTLLSLNEALQQAVERENQTYPDNTVEIQAVMDARDAQWRAADAADNNRDPLVHEHLATDVAQELLEFQETFPNHVEVFITDVYGGLTGTTNRTSDYYQADEEWWQMAYNNGSGAIYISEPEYDDSAKALAFQIALPIRDRDTDKVVGILRTTYLASALTPILGEQLGETGETDLFIPGEVIHHFDGVNYEEFDKTAFDELQAAATLGMAEVNYEGTASIALQVPIQAVTGDQAVNELGWLIVFHQHQDEAFAPISTQVRGVLVVVAIILLLAVGAAVGLSVLLVRPIEQLTRTSEEVAAGNLNARATVSSSDEVGILASTFNSMTSQLQETLSSLEERVAARTRDLATVAEVGTATATILESKRLLQEVVDLTKERFNLYHSHIYLLDEKGEKLVLTAGAGESGRIMVSEGRSISLSWEQSLVARAARERKGVIVNDVTQTPDFLPNPLLPDTRSELAVPMIVGGTVIGVFDIQSEQVGRFTDSDVNIQTTLAAQLATSIQNVRSFEQSRKQAEVQSLVNVIGSRIQRTTTIEETLQTAIRELGTSIGASRVKASITSTASTKTTGAN